MPEISTGHLLHSMGLAPMQDERGKTPMHPDEKASIGEIPLAPTAKSRIKNPEPKSLGVFLCP